jgi:cytochrome c-type biogenesis protein CcsB
MKRIVHFFSSTRTMAVVFILFFISIAAATFIENDFGSPAARKIVYNAKWFELLLLTGMINLIAVIFKHKVYKKPALFLFHLSFILIIAGAGVTRYFGFEGLMSIREGFSSNVINTSGTYLTVSANLGKKQETIIKPVNFSEPGINKFSKNFHYRKESLSIKLKQYIPSSEITIEPADDGIPIAEIVFQGWNPVFIRQGEVMRVGNVTLAFDTIDRGDVNLTLQNDELYLKSVYEVPVTNMSDQSVKMIPKDKVRPFVPMTVHNFNNQLAVLRKYLPSGRITAYPASKGVEKGADTEALLFEISSGREKKEVFVWGKRDQTGKEVHSMVNGNPVTLSYGSKMIQLPFNIQLDDFILERYPGSNSPSWYESRVNVIDENGSFAHRIFMNNILKHRGYRFYQASYDADEKGTVLSVNYDTAGTLITYFGYLLMGLGMLLSLFSSKSRFMNLLNESKRLSQSAKITTAVLGLFFLSVTSNHAQKTEIPIIDKKHAASFGALVIQDHSGRIKPVNSYSSEFLRKIARRTSYNNLSSDQVLLGIILYPELWQKEPLIKVGHEKMNDVLGISGKYIPFEAFFSKNNGSYLLYPYVNDANTRKPANRSKFDTEIIRTDERLNVFYMAYSGGLLKIFPQNDHPENKWFSPVDVKGNFNTEDTVFVNNIFPYYLSSVARAIQTGDWKEADEMLSALKKYQEKFGGDIYPSSFKIKLEIFYNKVNILDRLSSVYGVTGFILLLIQFFSIFFRKINLKIPVRIASIIIYAAFGLHTLALAARWHLAGHAPWSNGYEALTYIAWATVLAGIIFSFRLSVALSATSVLAFLILHTAHLSWMDPQITTLAPVLKSYWLIIHVAIITASYAFLGLAALLGAINLLTMFLQTSRHKERTDLSIKEISNIIEISIIVGLYLLTIGTFLGGVWANESWGRYWAWDPKETWALATILVYAFIAHMRMIPGLKSQYLFNLLSLIGFSSVIMTYFGVNYYLSGLHSYAKGDNFPIPMFVYYTLAAIFVVSTLAFINQKKLNTRNV